MITALDLEASLIDNAISGRPRPGLRTFVEFCMDNFERVALLTTVEETDARDVLYSLADKGVVPEAFTSIEYIKWQGEFKDLRYAKDIEPGDVVFLNDDESWIHPSQKDQWVQIEPWHGDPTDTELARIKQVISKRLSL